MKKPNGLINICGIVLKKLKSFDWNSERISASNLEELCCPLKNSAWTTKLKAPQMD